METQEKIKTPIANSSIQLRKLSESCKPKLIIPASVESIIRHLCNRVHNVEWSGVLFYSVEGSWKDRNLVLTCKDIHLMDIGNSTYTEFDVNPTVVSYLCDHPELMDCQMGLIHSHQSFGTFFSGTDTATLQSEGSKRNHFLSLIVNNAGTYTAGITRCVNVERTGTETLKYSTFENIEVEEDNGIFTSTSKELEWVELDIMKESVSNNFEELDARLDELSRPKVSTIRKKTTPSFTSINNWEDDDLHNYPGYYSSNPSSLDFVKYPVEDSYSKYDNYDNNINIVFTENEIKTIVLQLITGAVTIADESRIDPLKWSNSMEKIMDKRFREDIKYYKAWAESFCEFIIMYPIERYEKEDEFIYADALSAELIKALRKLNQNKYIKELISILQTWTIE